MAVLITVVSTVTDFDDAAPHRDNSTFNNFMLVPTDERFVVSAREVIKTLQLCACEAFTEGWNPSWALITIQPLPMTLKGNWCRR